MLMRHYGVRGFARGCEIHGDTLTRLRAPNGRQPIFTRAPKSAGEWNPFRGRGVLRDVESGMNAQALYKLRRATPSGG